MSDFIYSKKSIKYGELTSKVRSIYHDYPPFVEEYHGDWGSLAVSSNLYNGFLPYETNRHICVVIGGPILCFQDNGFLKNENNNLGTQAIYSRWINGKMQWDEDLSGPFVILIIDKNNSNIYCITDLMSFIPVYSYQNSTNIILSTHVDMLADAAGQKDNIDNVSSVDFILHGVVTFPYTLYSEVRQVTPASVHYVRGDLLNFESKAYWIPKEKNQYESIKKAADDLRRGLKNYVNTVTSELSSIAQFISGGEDSRTLAALLKSDKRDAFIFLDGMNREGRVAKKTSLIYGANFKLATRSKLHYLDILPVCSDLVGSGSQYKHAHTYGFHSSCEFKSYSAVFGGLFADALFKGARIKKIRRSGKLPFFPEIKQKNYSQDDFMNHPIFETKTLAELTKRRQAHLKYIQEFRNESAMEWFELWPSSMNMNIPNLHANRRLFRSYEPFMSKESVKISASVPQKWKLNRKLFHKAVKPLLRPTKWLFHSEGKLPYYPWYINSVVQFIFRLYKKIGTKTGLVRGNQGPWGEWDVVMSSTEWQDAMHQYSDGLNVISSVFNEKNVNKLFEAEELKGSQRVNLMQILYSFHKGNS